MVRHTFFSFHYEEDIWRSCIVRNSWLTKKDREAAGFWDKSLWEDAKKKGDEAIKRMINNALAGTSVTVVLIGSETSNRKWVRYEIKKSHEDKKGLLGVYIHNIKDNDGKTCPKGDNQFGEIDKDKNGGSVYFWQLYPTYDYIDDDGCNNIGKWIEKAAEKAGR